MKNLLKKMRRFFTPIKLELRWLIKYHESDGIRAVPVSVLQFRLKSCDEWINVDGEVRG